MSDSLPRSAHRSDSAQLGILMPAITLALMWAAIGWTYLGEPAILQFMVRVMVAPFVALILTLAWWLFFTRITWFDRLLVVGVAVGALLLVLVPHGADAMMYLFGILPVMVTGWLAWLILTPWMGWSARHIGLMCVIVACIGFFGLVRIEGLDGEFQAEYKWRWTPTAEQKLMAKQGETPGKANAQLEKPKDLKAGPADWPAFRGVGRDSVVKDVTIATDWKTNPPKVLWKHNIGPGWSSFAAVGKLLFTQEQRGEDEMVVCYDADTGLKQWTYSVPTRFTEAIAGAGPRATPTYHEGKLYCQGANGHLVCLDAYTGAEIWKRNLTQDTQAPVPTWGFSGSPLVHKGLVSVYAGAKDKTLTAYKLDTGEIAWTSERETKPELSYCSTHLATFEGVESLLILSDRGASAYEPETGKLIWTHDWETSGVVRCVQPALIEGKDFLIGTGLGIGTQRVHVERKDGKWMVNEVWKTTQFKPYYNDMVLHEGHAYGYDNNFFCCVDLKDGKVKWKARGYGTGQALLLAKQGLLLIVTEKGELALVEAKPGAHKELGKIKVIEGKTWNHPILVNGRVYLRNGEEFACVELPKGDGPLAKDGK